MRQSTAFMQKEVDVIYPLTVEQVAALKQYKDGRVTMGPEVRKCVDVDITQSRPERY